MDPHERLVAALDRIVVAALARDDADVALSAASNCVSIHVHALLRSPASSARLERAECALDRLKQLTEGNGNGHWSATQIRWAEARIRGAVRDASNRE